LGNPIYGYGRIWAFQGYRVNLKGIYLMMDLKSPTKRKGKKAKAVEALALNAAKKNHI